MLGIVFFVIVVCVSVVVHGQLRENTRRLLALAAAEGENDVATLESDERGVFFRRRPSWGRPARAYLGDKRFTVVVPLQAMTPASTSLWWRKHGAIGSVPATLSRTLVDRAAPLLATLGPGCSFHLEDAEAVVVVLPDPGWPPFGPRLGRTFDRALAIAESIEAALGAERLLLDTSDPPVLAAPGSSLAYEGQSWSSSSSSGSSVGVPGISGGPDAPGDGSG